MGDNDNTYVSLLEKRPHPVLHFILEFNDMVMSVCDSEEQCHEKAKFWLCWDKTPTLEFYMKLNGIVQIDNKKTFGILVASRIIQLLHT